MPTTKNATRTLLASLSASALLIMGACSGGDDPGPAAEPSAQQGTAAPVPSQGSVDATPAESVPASPGTGAPEAPQAELQAAIAAIAAAEQAGQGRAVQIEFEDGAWEIDVMQGDRVVEYRAAEDGTVSPTDESDDVDEGERRALEAAEVTLTDAIQAALQRVPGALEEAELDEENGQLVYQVDVRPEGGGVTQEVDVDCRTGEVLQVTDDDD